MTATTMNRLAIGAAGAAVLVIVGAGAAGAHVNVSPGEAEAGSHTVLTFAVPHGCDGSATTEIAIQIPEQTPAVTPTVNPNWDVEKVIVEQDDAPARVEQVVYTAKTPLPDGMRDTFKLSLLMPDSPGETLAFPVVQTCEDGETEWSERAAEGEDPHSLDAPAPLVTLTAPSAGDGHGTAANAAPANDGADDDADNGLGIAGLATGVLGIAVGGTALARTRRQAW